MSAAADHYAALRVGRGATLAQIKTAFRTRARELHPDTSAGDPAAARRFARMVRAYDVLVDPVRRRAYDTAASAGRFAAPGTNGPATYQVEETGPVYHSDLGHHSDFYQAGDPLSVSEAAALVGREKGWLRRAIRTGRLAATRGDDGYLLRRRDVERLDRTASRRGRGPGPV